MTLTWRWIVPAHLAGFLAWHHTYGAMQQPFFFELPGNLFDLSAGTRLQMRNPQEELEIAWLAHDRYEVVVELIEDLPTSIYVPGPETIGLTEDLLAQTSRGIGETAGLTEQLTPILNP
jgi:hypothetical protein